ncbi:MAG TPA: hypothetical protein VLE45_05280 [Burkholderiaceae bacterium]|nr:hypothetical protein [Burkholderiaceae bacterium]
MASYNQAVVVGSTAAFLLGVHEDLGLIAAGVPGAWAALER